MRRRWRRRRCAATSSGDVGIGLEVDARHLLLALGHDAQLPRRAPRASVTRSRGIDAAVGEALPQLPGRLVVAHHADQRHRRPQRREVHRDVGGAAGPVVVVVVLDDRDGSLGRQPLDTAEQEVVEHHVADDDHAATVEALDQRPCTCGPRAWLTARGMVVERPVVAWRRGRWTPEPWRRGLGAPEPWRRRLTGAAGPTPGARPQTAA